MVIGGSLVGHSSLPARRVLYLTHRVPFPPDKGDRIRAARAGANGVTGKLK